MVGEIINNRVPNAFNLEAKSNKTHCPKVALSRNTYLQHHLVLYHSTIHVQVRFSIDYATASFLGIQCDVQTKKYWNNNWTKEVPVKPRIDIYFLQILLAHDQAT